MTYEAIQGPGRCLQIELPKTPHIKIDHPGPPWGPDNHVSSLRCIVRSVPGFCTSLWLWAS